MPNDLDDRIRALVLEVVDQTPTAPDFGAGSAELTPRRDPRSGRAVPAVIAFSVAVVVLAVILGLGLIGRNDAGSPPGGRPALVTSPLSTIPEGVTAAIVKGRAVFFVREGEKVSVLISDAQHLKGETTLWWCPREQVFVAPTHGETFLPDGTKFAGPARRGLDQMHAQVRGNRLVIDARQIIRGAPSVPSDHFPPFCATYERHPHGAPLTATP